VEETPGLWLSLPKGGKEGRVGKEVQVLEQGRVGLEQGRVGLEQEPGVGRSWQTPAPLRPGLGLAGQGLTTQSPPAVPHLILASGLSDFSSCKTTS
jgi:hypothetical protein